jgi:transcriptional regulator of acetoin/glycerol metabolism
MRSLAGELERLGAVPGARFTESTTGTNSIATTFEEGAAVAVVGDEHYLESFRGFACYGMPLRSPVTRRTLGVIDITCRVQDASSLLGPFLARAARDIESRLVEGSGHTHRRLLAAFEATRSRTAGPHVAYGDDVLIANRSAADLLQPADHAALQALAHDHVEGIADRQRTLRLSSKHAIDVRVRSFDGAIVATMQPLEPRRPIPRSRRATRPESLVDWHENLRPDLDRFRAGASSVVVSGEAGTGRSTVAAYLGGCATDLGPSAAGGLGALEGAGAIEAEIDAVIDRDPSVLLVEHADLLEPHLAARLAQRWTALRERSRLILTSGPAGLPPGEWTSLAAHCPVGVELAPVRADRGRIPAFAASYLSELTAGQARFSTGALRALAGSDWPGNLTQLRTVIEDVTVHRGMGDITERDLPLGNRGTRSPAVAGTLWQAERDAILRALRECRGNKVHAADRLGISRNALYRRLRVLKIDAAAV